MPANSNDLDESKNVYIRPKTVGALDMGGASMQIAMEVTSDLSLQGFTVKIVIRNQVSKYFDCHSSLHFFYQILINVAFRNILTFDFQSENFKFSQLHNLFWTGKKI